MARPPKGSKTSLKEHLKQVYKQTGRKPKQLAEQGEFPSSIKYVIDWYVELRGLQPLTYSEIKSWCQLLNVPINPEEVRLIRRLDTIYWEGQHNG